MDGEQQDVFASVSSLLSSDLVTTATRASRAETAFKVDVTDAIRQGHLQKIPKKVGIFFLEQFFLG